jgi:hypothetical protein
LAAPELEVLIGLPEEDLSRLLPLERSIVVLEATDATNTMDKNGRSCVL